MFVYFELDFILYPQAYSENICIVWNAKVSQGQNLETCGASLQNYIDAVSLAVFFHFLYQCIKIQFTCKELETQTESLLPVDSQQATEMM